MRRARRSWRKQEKASRTNGAADCGERSSVHATDSSSAFTACRGLVNSWPAGRPQRSGRPVHVRQHEPAGSGDGDRPRPIAEYDYTYRKDGLKAIETDDFWFQNNGQNVEVTNHIYYTYDSLDRLIDEVFMTDAETVLGYDASLPSNVQQWASFSDAYTYDLDSNMVGQVTHEQQADTTQTTASTYDANDRLVEQVETTSGGTSGSSNTTTEYTYNDTEQTSETVISGTPSSPGTIHSSQEYQYNVQGQTSGATVTTYTSGQVSQVEQQTYGYDTDGNRVSVLDQIGSSAGSWTSQTLTEYLNDSNNPTGYTQVLAVLQSDATSGHTQQATQEAIGLQPISQTVTPYTNGQPGTPTTLYFGYDGQGSVRVLTNSAGAVATAGGARQVFNYDAYGNAVGFSISAAATTLLYDGQQTDAATGLQYLRARYYNPENASFTSFDSFDGNLTNPLGYNKYLFTEADPVNATDPTGHEEAEDTEEAVSIGESADATSAGASMSAGNGAVARLLTGVAEFDLYAIQYAAAELLQIATPYLTLLAGGTLLVSPNARDAFMASGANPAALAEGLVLAPGPIYNDIRCIAVLGQDVATDAVALEAAAEAESQTLLQRYLSGSGGRWGGNATRLLNHKLATNLEADGYDVTGGAGRDSEDRKGVRNHFMIGS